MQTWCQGVRSDPCRHYRHFATIAFLLLRSLCRVMTNLNFVNGGSIMPNFKRTQFCTHNPSHNLPSRNFGQGLIQLKELQDHLFTPTTIQIGVNDKFKKWLNQLVSSELQNFLIQFECFQEFLFFTCPDQSFSIRIVDTWIWRAVATTYLKQLLFRCIPVNHHKITRTDFHLFS